MKSKQLLSAGILATAALCGSAQASRGITINAWTPVTTGPASTWTDTSVVVNLTNPVFQPLENAGVAALSLTPGTSSSGFYMDSFGPGSSTVEFAWGGDANTTNPVAQIILRPVSTTSFTVSFGYAPSVFPASASFTLNGTTYTTDDPANAFATLGQNTTNDGLCDTAGKSCMTFVDTASGVALQDSSYWTKDGWTITPGSAKAAPEIDPASAISALTLLAGAVTILASYSPRRRVVRIS